MQHIMKENLLLLKDLLEPSETKFTNTITIYKLIHINFKAQEFEIVPYPLCLGSLSKVFSPSNTHRTGLSGYVYDFSVDYWVIANDEMLDMHKYLMKNNNIA